MNSYNEILDIVISEIPYKTSENPFGIVFLGGPGFGKSTIAKYLSDMSGVYITSNDRIRRIMEEKGNEPDQKLLEKVAEERTKFMLKNKISMIIDANMMFHWKDVCNNFEKYNTKLYFIKIECPEDVVLDRIHKREKLFDVDKTILSRAVESDYFRYKDKLKLSDFPEHLIFHTINSNCNLDDLRKQIEHVYDLIVNDVKY